MFSAFELTGGYFNPSLATGLKLGCLQEDPASHFLVGKYDILRCLLLLLCLQRPESYFLTRGYSRLSRGVVVQAHQNGGPVRQPFAIVDYISESLTKNLDSICFAR
jgi:hypothetical protein